MVKTTLYIYICIFLLFKIPGVFLGVAQISAKNREALPATATAQGEDGIKEAHGDVPSEPVLHSNVCGTNGTIPGFQKGGFFFWGGGGIPILYQLHPWKM